MCFLDFKKIFYFQTRLLCTRNFESIQQLLEQQIVEFVKAQINQSASIIAKVVLDIVDDKPNDVESYAISA